LVLCDGSRLAARATLRLAAKDLFRAMTQNKSEDLIWLRVLKA